MHHDSKNIGASESDILRMLNEMDLTGMADEVESMLCAPEQSRGNLEWLRTLVRKEYEGREFLKDQAIRHSADLRYPEASLDGSVRDPARNIDTDLLDELSTCNWVRKHNNTVITGAPGTGKSYLASALGVKALTSGLKVRMASGPSLLYDLSSYTTSESLYRAIERLLVCNLLIIDDFSLMTFDRNESRIFFELMEFAADRNSIIVVSSIAPVRWHELFDSRAYADAVSDRIMHHAFVLDIGGRDMWRSYQPEWEDYMLPF